MLAAAFYSWLGWLQLGNRLLVELFHGNPDTGIRRAAIFIPAWFAFGLLNAIHWVGFLLDEFLFSRYRSVTINRPVFVLGVPRSGTTHLHRVLADDEAFTTLSMFECVIAPSLTERYAYGFVGRLFGGIARLVDFSWLESRFAVMDDIHRIRLDEPEEDFLLFLWVQACFLGVVVCPHSEHYWNLGRFDEAVPEQRARHLMGFYRRMMQRHLLFHGTHRRYLSKNPSFTPMVGTLKRAFPDAVVVACVREPVKTVPSQLSSLLPAFEVLGEKTIDPDFRERMITLLHHYYGVVAGLKDTAMVVPMSALREDLATVVDEICERAGHMPSAGFRERLTVLGEDGRQYASGHHYSLEDFALSAEAIDARFADRWPLEP